MEWINEADDMEITPNSNCWVYFCIDREEACETRDKCLIKQCIWYDNCGSYT